MSSSNSLPKKPLWGQALFEQLQLPSTVFPASSWARAPLDQSPDDKKARAAFTSQGQLITANNSPCDAALRDATEDGALDSAFQTINIRHMHGLPETRLFSRSERYAYYSRVASAGGIALAKIRQTDGSLSRPVVITLGSSATFPQGEIVRLPAYDRKVPSPTTPASLIPEGDWPEEILPLLCTVAPSTRQQFFTASKSREELINDSCLLVVPDARPAMEHVCLEIRDGAVMSTAADKSPYKKAHLWAPFSLLDENAPSEYNSWAVDQSAVQRWLTGPCPSDPTAADPWNALQLDVHDADPPSDDDKPRPSMASADALVVGEMALDKDDPPGVLVASKLWCLPQSHNVPPGFIADPATMSLDEFLDIIAKETGRTDAADGCSWLDQPFLQAWWLAAQSHPEELCVILEPYSSSFQPGVVAKTKADENQTSHLLHLEWSILHQLLVDYLLATAKDTIMDRVQKHLEAVHASAVATSTDTPHPVIGCHDHVMQSVLALHFRPPKTKAWSTECHFHVFESIPATDLPLWARSLTVLAMDCKTKSASNTITPIAKQPNPAAQSPSKDGQAAAPQTPAKPPPAVSPFGNFAKRKSSTPLAKKRLAPPDPLAQRIPKKKAAHTSNHVSTPPPPAVTVTTTTAQTTAPTFFDPSKLGDDLDVLTDTATGSLWMTPQEQGGIDPLPPRKQKASSHEAAVLQHYVPKAEAFSKLTKDEKKDNCNRLLLHRQTMTSGAFQHEALIRRAATYGCFALPSDTQAFTITSPSQQYPASTLIAPGNLSQEFRVLFLGAHQKATNSVPFQEVVNWFNDHTTDARHSASNTPHCDFAPNFWDVEAITAALSWNYSHEPDIRRTNRLRPNTISPWHMLRSIPTGTADSKPTIPPDGLVAQDMHQYTENLFWIPHLCARDHNLFPILGHNESTFSRFSIFGGQLRFAALEMQSLAWQKEWNKQSPHKKLRRTVGLLYHFDRLHQIMNNFNLPSTPNESFFLRAVIGTDASYTLLRPLVSQSKKLLSDLLKEWRDDFTQCFSRNRLKDDPRSEGPFQHPVPSWLVGESTLQPMATPSPAPSTSLQELRKQKRLENKRKKEESRLAAAAGRTNDQRGSNAPPTQGMSVARVCIMTRNPASNNTQTIADLLASVHSAD